MHLNNFGSLIWIVILLAGFIANIVKKAKAQQAASPGVAAQAAAQRAAMLAAGQQRAAQVAAQRATVAQLAAVARQAPAPSTAAVRAARPPRPAPVVPAPAFEDMAPAPPPPIVHDPEMGFGTGVPKRLFEGRQSLIWAVVMSEVLGKPKALAVEQHLWIPQSQPPST